MTPTKIAARKTELICLEANQGIAFLKTYHRQGSAQAAKSIYFGLIYKDELVAVAHFGAPRTAAKKREYSWELIRLCFKSQVRIQGGASKLLKGFVKAVKPEDFFTYQDTTGEATKVYEYAGLTLVKSNKKKVYLVAPGKTLSTAARGESYSIGEVTRRGPDALLGTSLGEIFDENGKRKTNPELFIDHLGWHLEETTGDRVYEWVNPSYTFYSYKISATDSEKYYYGISHVKQAHATSEECISDGYWGGGGTKFQNWKARHQENLTKEILRIFPSRKAALNFEAKLVNSQELSNPLCLNSTEGGARFLDKHALYSEGECEKHGLTVFRLGSCNKCFMSSKIELQECPVHGLTLHWESAHTCFKCEASKTFTLQECFIHGETKFRGSHCAKCSSEVGTIAHCRVHGLTTHRHGNCQNCKNSSVVIVKMCEIHGKTKHQGNTCAKCSSSKNLSSKECETHGLTKHVGDSCLKCATSKCMKQQGTCEIHGETKFQHGVCARCKTLESVAIKECPVHGETKHRGDNCFKCRVAKSFTLKECPTHGLVKHRGVKCVSCSNTKKKKI